MMVDFSTLESRMPMLDQMIRLIQALDDCRGFLASCETVPRVFSRTPVGDDEFEVVDRTLAALCGALGLRPFERCARRPSNVNSLELALSRYLAITPSIALPNLDQVPFLIEQWRQTTHRPAIETITASNGGRLHVEVWAAPQQSPDEPTILFLPISGVPMAALRPLMRELAQGHTALCWESSLLSGADPLPEIAGDPVMALAGEVVDVVRAYKLNQVHLVAICVATASALAAATMLGAQVLSLSICHAAVKVAEQELATPFEQQYNAMLQDACHSEEKAREVHATLLEPGFAMSMPTALAPFIIDPYTRLSRLRRHALVHGASTTFDARPIAGQITCPTLIITTRTDRMVHPEQSRQLAALLPNASLHELDDGSHLDVLLEGNAFLPLISSFISQHTPLLTEG